MRVCFRTYPGILVLCYLAIGPFPALAQIHIAPVALFLDDHQPTGRFVVYNTSPKPQSVSVDLVYGFPEMNEEGEPYLKTFEKAPDGAPSAADWIRFYPRYLILPPNQQQVIRFSARPPADLSPGEYWARPRISVSKVPVMEPSGEEGIFLNVNLVKRTFLSLNYRHQQVRTGLYIADLAASVINENGQRKLQLWADLKRLGNAAYLGEIRIGVYKGDKEIRFTKNKIAIYNDQRRRFTIDLTGLPKGSYDVRLVFDTKDRAKIQSGILSAPPVIRKAAFTIK